jgi:hypothetical protein
MAHNDMLHLHEKFASFSDNPTMNGLCKPGAYNFPIEDYRELWINNINNKVRADVGQMLYVPGCTPHGGCCYLWNFLLNRGQYHPMVHIVLESMRHPFRTGRVSIKVGFDTYLPPEHMSELSPKELADAIEDTADRMRLLQLRVAEVGTDKLRRKAAGIAQKFATLCLDDDSDSTLTEDDEDEDDKKPAAKETGTPADELAADPTEPVVAQAPAEPVVATEPVVAQAPAEPVVATKPVVAQAPAEPVVAEVPVPAKPVVANEAPAPVTEVADEEAPAPPPLAATAPVKGGADAGIPGLGVKPAGPPPLPRGRKARGGLPTRNNLANKEGTKRSQPGTPTRDGTQEETPTRRSSRNKRANNKPSM